jgi:hypothetical protein
MSFLLAIMSKLGGWLVQLAPYFLAYKAGKSEAKHDFAAAVNKVLEEDNEELRANSVLPDTAIADKLRDRAKAKRKDRD